MGLSVLNAWKKIFSRKICLYIMKQVNKHFKKQQYKYKLTTEREIKTFLATRIRIIFERNTVYKDHWKTSNGKCYPKKEIKWNRWRQIHQNFCTDIRKT